MALYLHTINLVDTHTRVGVTTWTSARQQRAGVQRYKAIGEQCPSTNSWIAPLFTSPVGVGWSLTHKGAAPLHTFMGRSPIPIGRACGVFSLIPQTLGGPHCPLVPSMGEWGGGGMGPTGLPYYPNLSGPLALPVTYFSWPPLLPNPSHTWFPTPLSKPRAGISTLSEVAPTEREVGWAWERELKGQWRGKAAWAWGL